MQIKNNWEIKSWKELSKTTFHDIIQLREKVFMVEQNTSYLDVDGKDKKAYHLYSYGQENYPVAYARLLPRGVSYDDGASVGRVVVDSHYRGKNLAREMMQIAIEKITDLFEEKTIIISAQTYLLPFYSGFDFKAVGKEYLEDNLPHIKMMLEK